MSRVRSAISKFDNKVHTLQSGAKPIHPRMLLDALPQSDYVWLTHNTDKFNDVVRIGRLAIESGKEVSIKDASINNEIIDLLQRASIPRRECDDANNNSSVRRGQIGEEVIARILTQCYGPNCIERTGNKARRSDMLVHVNDPKPCTIAIEVKNYTNSVRVDEINKFKRDLSLIPDVIGGVFVTIGGGKDGKAGDQIKYEYIDGRSMPIVFVYIDPTTSYTVYADNDEDNIIVGTVIAQMKWAVSITAQLGCALTGIKSIAREIITKEEEEEQPGYDELASIISANSHERVKARKLLSDFVYAMQENLLKTELNEDRMKDIITSAKVEEQINTFVGNGIASIRKLFAQCEKDELLPLVDKVIDSIDTVTSNAINSWVVKGKRAESSITNIRIILARGNKKVDVSFPIHYIKRDDWCDIAVTYASVATIANSRVTIALTDKTIELIEKLVLQGRQ